MPIEKEWISFRFMSNSLSDLVGNLSEVLRNDRCTVCKSCVEFMSVKDWNLKLKD